MDGLDGLDCLKLTLRKLKPEPDTLYYFCIGGICNTVNDLCTWQIYPSFLRAVSKSLHISVFDRYSPEQLDSTLERLAPSMSCSATAISDELTPVLDCSPYFNFYSCQEDRIQLRFHNYYFPYLGGGEDARADFKKMRTYALELESLFKEFVAAASLLGSQVIVANYALFRFHQPIDLSYLNFEHPDYLYLEWLGYGTDEPLEEQLKSNFVNLLVWGKPSEIVEIRSKMKSAWVRDKFGAELIPKAIRSGALKREAIMKLMAKRYLSIGEYQELLSALGLTHEKPDSISVAELAHLVSFNGTRDLGGVLPLDV